MAPGSRRSPLERALAFAAQYGLRLPILMAPMAGACPPALAAAVANAGGMGGCGALLMSPEQIDAWASSFRSQSNGSFQMNLWIPDPEPRRDFMHEADVRRFLARWGPEPASDASQPAIAFEEQCQAMLDARPAAISSIMGLYPSAIVDEMKRRGIAWFATATTVAEAREAERAGADAIIVQGMEAGGHRGSFVADDAEANLVGLMSLLPAVVDAVEVPVIAAGGIADGRGVAAALVLGAVAVVAGTAFLRAPEAGIPSAWADGLARAQPEDTIPTRAYSGRLGRSLRTAYVEAWRAPDAPRPAPYPVQRTLTQPLRDAATRSNHIDGISAWAGQSARLARAAPAAETTLRLWADAQTLLTAGY